MKYFGLWSIVLIACLFPVTLLRAQRSGAQSAGPPPGSAHQIEITGCLKRGNQPGTYSITDANGSTWNVIAGDSGTDLSKHIFHVVAIAGTEAAVPKSGDANSSQQAERLPQLRVLSLRMLSNSCTR